MQDVIQVKDARIKFDIKSFELDRKILLLVVSFLFARLVYQQEPLVLIMPFLALGYYLGSPYFIFALIGFVLGSASMSVWSIMMSALFAVSFFVLVQSLRVFRISLFNRILVTSVFAEVLVRSGILLATHLPITPFVGIFIGISFVFTWAFLQLGPLMKAKTIEVIEPIQSFIFIGTLLISFLGIQEISYGGISFSYLLIRFVLLISARVMGMGLSASLALMISFLLGSVPPYPRYEVMVLGVATTLAAVVGTKGKWMTLLMFGVMSVATTTVLGLEGWSLGIYRETLLASALFVLIPDRIFNSISKKFPTYETLKEGYQLQLQRQHLKMHEQMVSFSQMFHALSNQISLDEDNGMVDRHMGHVYRNVCINCPKSRICYQVGENKLVSLIRKALVQPLSNEDEKVLETNCLKPSLLYEVIEQRKRTYMSEYRYSKEYQSLKQVLIHHLEGVSSVIDHMKESLSYERSLFHKESENRLKTMFEQQQLDCLYVRVHEYYHHHEIELAVGGVTEKEMEEKVLSLVSKVMNEAYKVKEIHGFGNESYYSMRLVETKVYQTVYGVSQVAKDFHASGDTYAVFTHGPYVYAMISDGMGSGEIAQKQSQLTIDLLRRMITAGMDRSKALESVNSLLKIRNQYDMYATLDIMVLDTMKGRLRLSKNGAPATWIIREGQMLVEQSDAPPMGIVDALSFHDHEMEVKHGDIVVMMSDGFIPPRDEMLKEIFQNETLHPQQMARELLERATKKPVEDDITYIVMQIE